MTTTYSKVVIHPVIVIKVEGIKCKGFFGTGSNSNYISSTLLNLIKKTL